MVMSTDSRTESHSKSWQRRGLRVGELRSDRVGPPNRHGPGASCDRVAPLNRQGQRVAMVRRDPVASPVATVSDEMFPALLSSLLERTSRAPPKRQGPGRPTDRVAPPKRQGLPPLLSASSRLRRSDTVSPEAPGERCRVRPSLSSAAPSGSDDLAEHSAEATRSGRRDQCTRKVPCA